MKMSSAGLMKRLLHLRSRQCHPFCNLAFLLCSMLLSSAVREGFNCDTFTLLDIMECTFWLLPQMCFHHLFLFVSAHMSLQNEIPLVIVKLYGLVMPKTVTPPNRGFPCCSGM